MTKRKEVKVKNNPGITKIVEWDEKSKRWTDSGKFRSTRRIKIDGLSKRESAVFDNVEDAKSFRLGKLDKEDTGQYHKRAPVIDDSRMRFATLLTEWRDFHYMTVDYSTKQTYERQLKRVEEFLKTYVVDDIKPDIIDKMIREWKSGHAEEVKKGGDNKLRLSFERELDALKVVLNFYRMRKDPRFHMPIYKEHYRAARVVIKADHGVKSLRQEDLGLFLKALKAQKNPQYFPLALTQFCLSLRICEACALHWSDVDFKRREITIQRSIVWDHETWVPTIKERPKNGKARVLAIPEIMAVELERIRRLPIADARLVFHRKGVPLNRKTIGVAYNRAMKLCGITHVSGTHVLRKTSATQANAATGDFQAVSENLGHSNLEETQKYVEGLSESKRKVANALNDVAHSVLKSTAEN